MRNDTPYLSIVIVSRNDDHGANMFRRMQVCINGVIEQMERYKIPSELILVEWIPTAGRPLLKDIFPWMEELKYCSIRVIVVPPAVLGDYEWSEDFSIRDLTPWNVGIRRSRGEFVLSTVTDVLFSDKMAQLFAERRLDPGAMYRIDRCDVNREVLKIDGPHEQREYCRNNIVDMHTLNPLKFLLKRKIPVLHDKAPGDFILLSRERWHMLHGFPQGIAPGADNILLYMAHLSGAKQRILKKPVRLYHIDHDSLWKNPSYMDLRKALIRLKFPYKVVDVLSRVGEDLIATKSYLQKQNIMLHSKGEVGSIIRDMLDKRRHYIYNDSNWGLGDKDLGSFSMGRSR